MALIFECMPQCTQKAFDTAGIVRDGDVTPTTNGPAVLRIVRAAGFNCADHFPEARFGIASSWRTTSQLLAEKAEQCFFPSFWVREALTSTCLDRL
jgi:hypothetical protein